VAEYLKQMPDSYWKEKLTPEQYRVMREKGTETPWTGVLLDNHDAGMYKCAACGHPLFASDTKFESGTGWPSFYDVAEKGNVELHEDESLGIKRVEVTCANCGAHLGHLFPDGPADKTGQRYCINGCALKFESKAGAGVEVKPAAK
jgi:peptide-methionine (R)-S-oxide reductase